MLLIADIQEARRKTELRMKLQMAQFLQDTIEEMAVHSKQKKKGSSIQHFSEFFQQVLSVNGVIIDVYGAYVLRYVQVELRLIPKT